jgi:hypothetical protein
MKTTSKNSESGSIVVYALLVMTVMLAIGLTLSSLFANKIKAARSQSNSVVALYAADSATEFCLYEARTATNTSSLVMGNGATFNIDSGAQKGITDCSALGSDTLTFRATGAYFGSQRTLEISQ